VVTPSVQPLASLKSLMPPEMFALYSAPDPHAAFARAVGKTPVWILHGGQDDTVEYPEEKHFIADRVFTDAEFWEWLMGQRLSQ
jgi:predicted peptidase